MSATETEERIYSKVGGWLCLDFTNTIQSYSLDKPNYDYIGVMPERDASQDALEQVQKITESDPVNGEDLLGSEDLKRQLREAREREAKHSTEPPRK